MDYGVQFIHTSNLKSTVSETVSRSHYGTYNRIQQHTMIIVQRESGRGLGTHDRQNKRQKEEGEWKNP